MKRLIKMFSIGSVAMVFLASCSANVGDGKESKAPLKPLSCIAVMPAGTAADKEETVSYDQARSLENGAAYASGIMTRELSGNVKVRIINTSQAASIAPEVSGGMLGVVTAIGKKVGCDGVLMTTVRRFKQREGTEYAAESPASVDLHMTLLHARSGAVLWTADFGETQESFLENILTFDKMQNRGFKWVTAEQLMEQGISERLATCPYLQ